VKEDAGSEGGKAMENAGRKEGRKGGRCSKEGRKEYKYQSEYTEPRWASTAVLLHTL
jgi:hypothetical protein